MKVRQLMELLAEADQDAEVIMQKDAEGNGYSPLADLNHEAVYVPENAWSGFAYLATWSAEEACQSESEWNALKSMPRCVVLFPTN